MLYYIFKLLASRMRKNLILYLIIQSSEFFEKLVQVFGRRNDSFMKFWQFSFKGHFNISCSSNWKLCLGLIFGWHVSIALNCRLLSYNSYDTAKVFVFKCLKCKVIL